MRTGNKNGRFGIYGGQYVSETLMPVLIEVEKAYNDAKTDDKFMAEMVEYLENYVGRPSPLYFARRLTAAYGGPKIYLKREDLNHTGAHKINNTLGQALLARRMGKSCLMAETGAGQHGVATATVAALFGMKCVVYMGEEDIRRQAPNVGRMRLLGAEVVPVRSGTRTLKDAMSEALRAWVADVDTTFYVIGSVAGPHPYPVMVRDFQAIIGRETRDQIMKKEGRLPDRLIACVGGGSNAAGLFYPFVDDDVELIGVEAAGRGISTGEHAASIGEGSVGVLHGSKSYVLQDEYGQIINAHSVSAGLDYPGVGPEHSFWAETGRVQYCSITDEEALGAFYDLARFEGILPALEPSHALAELRKRAPGMGRDNIVVLNLSGRGDKDVDTVFSLKGSSGLEKHGIAPGENE